MDDMLRGFWYLARLGASVKRASTAPVTLLGEQVLLGRRADGSVFAFGDSCPHRGMPMREGTFDGTTAALLFHGWAFDSADGRCTDIPSVVDGAEPGRFRLKAYPAREVQGNIWVFMAASGALPDPLPDTIPEIAAFGAQPPKIATTMRFPCNVDLAASGFFDPGHPAFVHTSRWWRSKPVGSLRPKEKSFTPDGMGFAMARHPVRGGGLPYKLLGGDVHAEIRIGLPGIRTEVIEGRRHAAYVLAAATPVSATETDVHYLRLLDAALADRAETGRRHDGPRLPPAGSRRGRAHDGQPEPAVAAVRRRRRYADPLVFAAQKGVHGRRRRGPCIREPATAADAAVEELMDHRPIASGARIGHVHLKVSDIERALGFYVGVLGLELMLRYGTQAAFVSAGGYHHHIGLNTWESAGGHPPAPGTTGLFHLALLYPERADLADALRRLIAAGIPLDGASDHGVSEALYLRDPDQNGVELYWDRPQAEWPQDAQGGLTMFTRRLDLESLLAA